MEDLNKFMSTKFRLVLIVQMFIFFTSCKDYKDNFEIKNVELYLYDLAYDSDLNKYYASDFVLRNTNEYSLLVTKFNFAFYDNPNFDYSPYDGAHGPKDKVLETNWNIKDSLTSDCLILDEETHYSQLPYDPNVLHSWVRQFKGDSICGIANSPLIKDLYNNGEEKGDVFLWYDPFYVVSKELLREHVKNNSNYLIYKVKTDKGTFVDSCAVGL